MADRRDLLYALPNLAWWRSSRRVAALMPLPIVDMPHFNQYGYLESACLPRGVAREKQRGSRSASPSPSRSPSPSPDRGEAADSPMPPPPSDAALAATRRSSDSYYWFFEQTDPMISEVAAIPGVHTLLAQQALEALLKSDKQALSGFLEDATDFAPC